MNAEWFQQALTRAGVSQADLARHLRLAPSAVSRMLKGERQMKLHEAVQVAALLGVSRDDVLQHAAAESVDPPSLDAPRRRGRPASAQRTASSPALPASLPIRGAVFGRGGTGFASDAPIGWTTRLASLNGVRDAYAVYMIGTSMEPRYEEGWLLQVNPFKPPTRGRDVVVHKANGASVVAQLVGWDNDALVLRCLNPEGEMRVPKQEVASCHLIVGVDQEG